MMRMFMRKLILQIVFILILGCFTNIVVHADGERTSFGSESYQWELDTESPIGIYAHATRGIRTVEIYVQYDPTMLTHQSGGELIEAGRIRIAGNVNQVSEYQQMLHFIPLVAGETQITIEESSITDVYAEVYTTTSINVPVSITLPTNWSLTGLQVNGALVENFLPTTLSYTFETQQEELEVVTFPDDFQVELSKNMLNIGENEIYAVVANDRNQKVRYTLHINRIENENQHQEENIAIEENSQEAQLMIQGNHTQAIARRNQGILYVLLVVLLIVLFILVRLKMRISKTNRHTRPQKSMNKDIRILDLEKTDELDAKTQSKKNNQKKNVVIAVKHVIMDFKRERDESTSIKEHFIRTIKGEHSYEMFRALDDVSFQVKAGEVVGIIGTNGSGKSTILKIISGVLAPTEGSVKVDTSKVQLLTLGTGFDFELTGRENVYLNGSLIGYTKEFIDSKYDEIVEFAELDGFMEEKVRNYSSGMVSRLGFAIATISNTPDILILDEVLSVGDMFFRTKSTARIKEMIHGGSTVLIVSHSTATIQSNCSKAIWLDKGKLRAIGNPQKVCDAYGKMNG